MDSDSISWWSVILIWIGLAATLLRDRIWRAVARWRRPAVLLVPGERAYWIGAAPGTDRSVAEQVVVVEALPWSFGYSYVVRSEDNKLILVRGRDLVPNTSETMGRP